MTAALAATSARDKLTVRELGALRAELARELRADAAAAAAARKASRTSYRETPEVHAAAVRMVRALGKRAGTDVDALPLLAQLADVVEDELAAAVAVARSPEGKSAPWSWADVGRVLGMTRQAAQQRFGRRQAAAAAPADVPGQLTVEDAL